MILVITVHVEGYGQFGWAKNEESAGTTNGKKRMEAIQICLVNKGKAKDIIAQTCIS